MLVLVYAMKRIDWLPFEIEITIKETRPCNKQRFFKAVIMTIFSRILLIIFIFLLKTYNVGTR